MFIMWQTVPGERDMIINQMDKVAALTEIIL